MTKHGSHLSVRTKRELAQLKRRVSELEEIGDENPKVLVNRYAKTVARELRKAPLMLRRSVYALARVMAIPKSTRGRKPAHATK
jgi:hypothetical protein